MAIIIGAAAASDMSHNHAEIYVGTPIPGDTLPRPTVARSLSEGIPHISAARAGPSCLLSTTHLLR